MLVLRSFLPRIALLFALILAPLTLVRGNISIIEASNSDVSGMFRTGSAEIDQVDLAGLQPSIRAGAHRLRAMRSVPGDGARRPRAALVADLRPARISSPVPHPPVRRPPPRFLN
ncbi:hypothetical protein SOCE836_083630 [Sorangium cellulosum]|uniref:Uncharacterized protein n=1 Tax=Sorangium cellulosum TaxID=56 RepID=A0A4P2QZU6_SORCE|nr:hypothetical protein SOCE836_083630 [Sorangium cellulosum]